MEVVHENLFRFEGDRMRIRDLVVDYHEVVTMFRDMSENAGDAELADRLAKLIYLGYVADRSIITTAKVDYVKEGFESMTKSIDSKIENDFADAVREKIDELLGGEGTFTREMQETFGEDGKHSQQIQALMDEYRAKLAEVLDPGNDASPFRILEKNMEEKYSAILQFMNRQAGRASAEERAPQKGKKFEDLVSGILGESSQVLGCNMENTSNKRGISGKANAKKGDFVLTEKKTGKRIVLEAKNLAKDPATRQILQYASIALENREADYCVYLYSDSDDAGMPEAGMFNEVAENVLFVAVSESDPHEAKKRMILFACSWALARVRAADGGVDLDEKMGRLETRLRKSLDTIKAIKTNSQDITNACKSMMADLEEDLELKQEKLD